ncbi:MAG: hypothetical protein RJA70_3841 [Pseudomonadota bacterium]|jgi:hypothetical protein
MDRSSEAALARRGFYYSFEDAHCVFKVGCFDALPSNLSRQHATEDVRFASGIVLKLRMAEIPQGANLVG